MFAAFAAYCRARQSNSKAQACLKNDTTKVSSTEQKKKKKASESFDDDKPSAKRRRQAETKADKCKDETRQTRKSPRAAASRKVNYNEESSSDDEGIDEVLEEYRPTKSIKSTTKATKRAKRNPRSIYSFAPLTGQNAANKSSLPGPGWTLGHREGNGIKKRSSLWISPQRKIMFQRSIRAHEFESIRQKYDGDEFKAWEEFRNLFKNTLQCTSVVRPRQYDSAEWGRPYKTHDVLYDLGWERFTQIQTCGGKKYFWLSPEFSIKFRFASAAMEFQAVLEECNNDEMKAWNEYLKKASKQRIHVAVEGGYHGLEKAKEMFGTKRA